MLPCPIGVDKTLGGPKGSYQGRLVNLFPSLIVSRLEKGRHGPNRTNKMVTPGINFALGR